MSSCGYPHVIVGEPRPLMDGVLARFGCVIPNPVGLTCSGGARAGVAGHVAWLIVNGVPWLVRRGRDLIPHAAAIMTVAALERLRRAVGPRG